MYHPRKAFSNLLRLQLGRSELVRENKAVLEIMSSALVELTARSSPRKLFYCPSCPLLEVTPHLHPSADDFLPLLFRRHSGSLWLQYGGVEGT